MDEANSNRWGNTLDIYYFRTVQLAMLTDTYASL